MPGVRRSGAGRKSRRGILGSLAALGAGLVGARAADAQVTQRDCGNQICASNPEGCNAGCVCCVYSNSNSRCRPPGTCSSGTEVGGSATTTTTTPAPFCATAPAGTQCGIGMVCSGGQCVGNGVCTSDNGDGCGPDSCTVGGVTRITFCAENLEGGVTRMGNITCDNAPTCASSAECPPGFVCFVGSCTTCVPICD